jgi:hypothetical protein
MKSKGFVVKVVQIKRTRDESRRYMASACRFMHRWSRYHLIETYSRHLTQIRVCTRCGQFDTQAVTLSSCRREDLERIWEVYHTGDLKIKKDTPLAIIDTEVGR